MKKNYFLAMALIAITVTSCSKEAVFSNPASMQASASASGTITAPVIKLALSNSGTNFGALIGAPDTSTNPYGFIINVAGSLGLSCLRDKAPVPGTKKVQTLSSVYNVLLNFSSTGQMPMGFRTDTVAYKNDLINTLSAFTTMPAVAVVENEESNTLYYNGSATDYINELQAAITVMHSYGIPVADGGITSTGLAYLVYENLLSLGLTAQASAYQSYLGVTPLSPITLSRASFVSTLLASFAVMNLDYVNFHWRVQAPGDSTYLGETISYLQSVTHKKVITNELGQYDQSPATVTSALQTCQNYNLPFVSWYSCPNNKSYPLQGNNQMLTQTGAAYQTYIPH